MFPPFLAACLHAEERWIQGDYASLSGKPSTDGLCVLKRGQSREPNAASSQGEFWKRC